MVEWKKLGEVSNRNKGIPITAGQMSELATPYGNVRVFAAGQTIADIDEKDLPINCAHKEPSVIVKSRGYIDFEFYEKPFTHKNEMWSYSFKDKQTGKFVYYYLTTKTEFFRKKAKANSVKLPQLCVADTDNYPIPIPSLSEQQRIVSILDTFTSSISNLKQQIEERRKQYEYERDLLLDLEGKEGVEMKKLEEVGDICMCKRIMKNQTSDVGDIPFFKIGTFGGVPDAYISRELFEEYKKKYSYPKKGEILISAAGTIGRSVVFDGEDAYFQDSNIVWISNNEQLVLNTFLRYLYGIIDWKIDGGTIKRLYNYNLKNATIYVPSLEAQSRIVSILDTFEQSISNLEEQLAMREKQYEYYRNQLLTFEGEEERGKT